MVGDDMVAELSAELANSFADWTLVESAGGVLSPGPGQDRLATQADLYAPLDLPVIMVGDANLGGISTTLAALESLGRRSYKVDAVVMAEKGLGNADAVEEIMGKAVYRLGALPPDGPLDSWHEAAEPTLLALTRDLEAKARR